MVSVGTIVWLGSEVMFFAGLFAIYFTLRSTPRTCGPKRQPSSTSRTRSSTRSSWCVVLHLPDRRLRRRALPAAAAPAKLRLRSAGAWSSGSASPSLWARSSSPARCRVRQLVTEHVSLISSDSYGSAFYLTTGFHALHVTGGLIAFLLVIGRAFAVKNFGHKEATTAIVVSYYWHFVDVVWIGLFLVIYVLK